MRVGFKNRIVPTLLATIVTLFALTLPFKYGNGFFTSLKPQSTWAEVAIAGSAAAVGTAEAHWDTFRGRYKSKVMSSTAPWQADYEHLLKERYGVETEQTGGDPHSPWYLGYRSAYNDVTRRELTKKYQRDVMAECFNAAKKAK
jgi:hypothetical protein